MIIFPKSFTKNISQIFFPYLLNITLLMINQILVQPEKIWLKQNICETPCIQNSNPADGATCNGWGWEPDG